MNFKKILVVLAISLLFSACDVLEELEAAAQTSNESGVVLADEVESLEYLSDQAGLRLQWAAGAVASSEYGNPDYGAMQAVGEPDTPKCGDVPTAWSSLNGSGVEWIELSYAEAVIPSEIIVFQSNAPNQIISVEVIDLEGTYHSVYTSTPYTEACLYKNSIPVYLDFPVNGVRINLDQSQIDAEWDEIDAVALIGKSLMQEAVAEVEDVVVTSRCNTDTSVFYSPASAPSGGFMYNVVGDGKETYTVNNVIKNQANAGERVIGFVSEDVTVAVTLFLPYDLSHISGCVLDLPVYDPSSFYKAPNLAIYATPDMYYPTSGQLYIVDHGDGTVSGAFYFFATHMNKSGSTVVVEGAFNNLVLP